MARTRPEDAVPDNSIDRTGEPYCVKSPPYLCEIPDFIAWTGEPYFFYAIASSLEVFAEFMKSFPS